MIILANNIAQWIEMNKWWAITPKGQWTMADQLVGQLVHRGAKSIWEAVEDFTHTGGGASRERGCGDGAIMLAEHDVGWCPLLDQSVRDYTESFSPLRTCQYINMGMILLFIW